MAIPRKGIPTEYAGAKFRSRLEARWAAFFDLQRWRWDYEPFDLDGYIPDFVLQGADPCLVEVKPFIGEGEFRQYIDGNTFGGWTRGPILLLGAGPQRFDSCVHENAVGLGLASGNRTFWSPALFCKIKKNPLAGYLFAYSQGIEWNRWGPDDARVCRDPLVYGNPDYDWRRAGGQTQWRPSRG